MVHEYWLLITIIILLSIDTTIFLQSLISQPIFSCQIIGVFVGNYEIGLLIGVLSQVFFLGYIPIGGARIPDPQIAPNLMVLLLANETVGLEIVGHWFPIVLILSFLFMYLISIERLIATAYMKYIPYRFMNINYIISGSFFLHFVLFYYASYECFRWLLMHRAEIESYFIYSGEHVFYFVLFFSLGNLLVRYFKWSR